MNIDLQVQPVSSPSPKQQISISKNDTNPKKFTETESPKKEIIIQENDSNSKKITESEIFNIFAIKTASKDVKQINVPKKKPKFVFSKILKESPSEERK